MKNDRRQQEIAIQNQVADQYDGVRYQVPHARCYHMWWVTDMLADTADHGLWLDLGCGTGWIHEVLESLGSRRRLVGIDISAGMLRHAQGKQLPVVRGDAQQLPFEDGCFDGVLAKGILHHIPDMEEAIAEVRRVLKPGGIAVMTDPNLSPLRVLKYVLRNRDAHFSHQHRSIGPGEYRRKIAASLEVLDFQYFGLLAYPAAFPDILPFALPPALVEALIRLDRRLAHLPLLKHFCWAFKLTARRARALAPS
jgi:ubiquinone/menaquinone biosynthesis C-methylase UbiE